MHAITLRTATFRLLFAMLAAGMAFALPASAQVESMSPASAASSGKDVAAAHNAAYELALARSFTTPQTVGEMLQCSAVWDRWAYVVESAADPAFRQSLRAELSARNAKSRQRHWQRMARREMRGDDEESYFERSRANAESDADELYAAYASGSERGISSMIGWLASCQ